MRNLFNKTFFALALLCGLSATVFGQTFNDGTLVYSVISGTEVRVGTNSSSAANGLVAGTSYSGAISIPETVINEGNTYSVTAIENHAFRNCSGLTSLTIPNSVTSIGNSAFASCSGLTSLTIPYSVTTIGNSAFYGCRGLTAISVSGTHFKLADNVGVAQVLIPYADNGLNSACSNVVGSLAIGNLTIPNSVTTIGNSAFYGCSGLTSLTIPNSVTTIGERAFYYCSGLTSLTIPNSVTAIGEAAFAGCRALTTIAVNAGNPNYSSIDGVLFSKLQDTLIQCPAGKTGGYTVPNSVTTIGDYAFFGCSGLTSVTIPNSVTTIGEWAFFGCSDLTSVTIPNSVTTIEFYTFSGCSGLTSVTIPNSVTTIGEMAFRVCSGLTAIIIGNSVTTIGNSAFESCSGLTAVIIGTSVDTIGSYAFRDCRGLTKIYVKAVTPPALGENVFYNVSDTIPVYVCGSVEDYRDAPGWSYFTNITEDCSGIEDQALEPNITLYPNPAKDNITVTLPENVSKALFVLYDMQGKALIRQEVSSGDAVEVRHLAVGIYLYQVAAGAWRYQGKVVKQ